MLQHFKDFYHWLDVQHRRIPAIPWNLGVTALFLCAAYWLPGGHAVHGGHLLRHLRPHRPGQETGH